MTSPLVPRRTNDALCRMSRVATTGNGTIDIGRHAIETSRPERHGVVTRCRLADSGEFAGRPALDEDARNPPQVVCGNDWNWNSCHHGSPLAGFSLLRVCAAEANGAYR